MTTGIFLVTVFIWLAWAGIWELVAAVTKQKEWPYITTLSRLHPVLRWTMALAFALATVWWVQHSAPGAVG